jgi:hypothetical protein
MGTRITRLRDWRAASFILAGLMLGAILFEPAVAHVTRSLRHLRSHLDPVYVNVNESAGGDLSGRHANLQIGANTVGASEISLIEGTTQSVLINGGAINGQYDTDAVEVSCASGQEIMGVNIDWLGNAPQADQELWISESRRTSATSWFVLGGNNTLADRTLSVTPLCFAAT